MSVDILGTNCDQCVSMVQCCFTSTETARLIRTESPGWPPRLSHSSRTLRTAVGLFYTVSSDRTRAATSLTPLTRLVGWHTAPACKMLGRAFRCYIFRSYIFRSYSTSTVNAMRFDDNPFTCRCNKEGEKA